MAWNDLVELLKGHKTYLQTHNFPDPDAIASAFGMQQFLKKHDIETTLCYCGAIDKISTKKMLTEFGIDIKEYNQITDMQEEDYIVTIDGQKYHFNSNGILSNTTSPTGSRTIKNYLAGALQPVGQALYVWGGGWNDSTRKGTSQTMTDFYNSQSSRF